MRWLLLTLVAGCWTGSGVEPSPANSSTETTSTRPSRYRFDELRLERTGCLGMCPTYLVTIHRDGRVAWTGRENVASMGARTGRVTRAQIRTLEKKLEAVEFDLLDERGQKPTKPECTRMQTPTGTTTTCVQQIAICSDTSHAIITLVRRAREKSVDNAHCDFEHVTPLVELERMIDDIAGTRDWIGR